MVILSIFFMIICYPFRFFPSSFLPFAFFFIIFFSSRFFSFSSSLVHHQVPSSLPSSRPPSVVISFSLLSSLSVLFLFHLPSFALYSLVSRFPFLISFKLQPLSSKCLGVEVYGVCTSHFTYTMCRKLCNYFSYDVLRRYVDVSYDVLRRYVDVVS